MPLVSILVEPAKVLFLNNAINHGVFSPLGVQQVAESGKSILFMIESNPGPGLGLLLAYFFFGPKSLRRCASAMTSGCARKTRLPGKRSWMCRPMSSFIDRGSNST